MIAARVLICIVALLAAGWVAASLQGARLEGQAIDEIQAAARITSSSDPEQRAEGRRRLDRAGTLFERSRRWAPAQALVISEAFLLAEIGRRAQAVELLRDRLSAEPRNSDVWQAYASLLSRSAPVQARRAELRARRLNPLGSGP